MNLSSTPDLSLYQLALDTLTSPQILRVSPATLKSLIGTLIDLLIEETIPATLWVKLPPTDGWQAEIKRYQQHVGLVQKIYLYHCAGDDLVLTDEVGQAAKLKGISQSFSVELAAGSQLKQEYFLIVLSDQFSSLIVADPCSQPEPSRTALNTTELLLAVCTFERRVIQRVCEGIKDAIAVADNIPKELLEPRETRFALVPDSEEKALLTRLLVKQVQRTEEIFYSSTSGDSPSVCEPMPKGSTGSSKATELTLTPLVKTSTTIPLIPSDNFYNKDELLKRVAQELRTPLTNMKTALTLVDSPQLKPAQRQRYMQLLNTECDRQNSLITGLLELVQLDSDPQPTVMPSVQLADIVPGVVSTYQPLAQEKGIQLGYTVPASLPLVSCVESWLRQILINLLHNSLKFTLAGGQVKVRATPQGKYVQLAISDTGVGIAASEIPRIFDSFYRGRSTTGENTGAGLGLTIVQQLLLRCGGSISVTSKLSEGSTFKALLPVASPTSTV
jgi:hypothetical protein